MKTILFIDKADQEVWDSYLRYDFVLDEYHEAGVFKVCPWNPQARSVRAAIPDLERLLGDEQEWQAVIVSDLRAIVGPVQDDRHYDNLFDFEESYGRMPGDPIEESSYPLVRLTQMLGGFPEQAVMSWPEKPEGGVLELGGYEVDFPALDERYDLAERYRLGTTRPQRILCVTPRDVDEDLVKMRRRDMAEHPELAYEEKLDFWERNGYPAMTRFVVCDRYARAGAAADDELSEAAVDGPEEEGEERRDDWFAFWMCVLTLMTASIQPSYLAAFTVYSAGVDIAEDELQDVFSRRYTEWAATREQIAVEVAGENERLRVSEYRMVDMPDCTSSISVDFDLVDERALLADASEVGLIRDVPTDDHKVWKRQLQRITDEFTSLLRAPRRAVLNSAMHFRTDGRLDSRQIEYCILNEYQREELEDTLDEQELELAAGVDKTAFSFESYNKSFSREDANIHREIGKRSTRRQTLFALVVGVAALIIGFLPYCFGVGGTVGANVAAFMVTAVCCVVLAGVVVLTLRRMRKDVQGAYYGFNASMNGVRRSMRDEAGRLSERISSYATFRKRWSLLDRQRRIGEPTARTLQLSESDALISTRMDDIRQISPTCGIDPQVYQEMKEGGWSRTMSLLASRSFFSVCTPCSTERRLNESRPSETDIVVPYSFIARVRLEPLDLC